MNFPNPEINQIMSIDSNQHCVDCSAPNPQFTSVNNGVFLCENCANAHKALGGNISLVKSLTNDQFTQDEVNLLRIGGNFRFIALISEYGISSEQNKEFKYHLKIADYYRKLLAAELNKVNNPNEFEQLQNNKPSAEEGLKIMESVTAESINQAQQNQNQNQNQNQEQNQEQNEISKDASALFGKVTGFFSSVGNALNNVVHQYGIDQKVTELKNSVNQGAKSFGENHPSIQNAASTAMEGIKTAGTYAAETASKIANSEPVKNIQQKVSETYQGVVNSETVKNLSKKAEEQYINLKKKANETFGSNNEQQPNQESNQQPNQESNQQPNQESNQQPNQESNQQPNQESNQQPNQEPNQQPNQDVNQQSSENNIQNPQP